MINSIGSALFDPAVTRALVPAQPAKSGGDASRGNDQPVTAAAVVPTAAQQAGLESRAGLIHQQNLAEDGINAKTRQALRAYRTLEEAEEREQVSRMLGVDEYA